MRYFYLFSILSFFSINLSAQNSWTTSNCTDADPTLQMVLVNSCGVEHYNEFILFSTGSSPYNLANLSLVGSNGIISQPATYPTATGFSGTAPFVGQIVTQLNTWAGCVTFQAAPNPIPPNSLVMVFNLTIAGGLQAIPPTPNLSAYCGKTVYVAAATSLIPVPGGSEGVFDDQQSSVNPITVNFSPCSAVVNYGNSFPIANGVYVTCDIVNKDKTQYNNPGNCFPPPCLVPDVTATVLTGTACIASNSDISLDAIVNNAPGAQYMWSGPNNYSSNIKNPVIVNNGLPQGTHTFTLKVATTGGCHKKSMVNVTIGPPLDFTVNDITVCGLTPVPYTVIGTPGPSAGATYKWASLTAPGSIAPNTTSAIVTITAPVSGSLFSPTLVTNYSVTVTETSGCSWVKGFKITTYPPPLTANVVNPINICNGQPINLVVTSGSLTPPFPVFPITIVPYPVEFKWTGPNGFTGAVTSASTPVTVTVPAPNYPGIGTHVYNLVASIPAISSHSSCASIPANVTVNVSAAGAIAMNTASICSGGNVNLNPLITSPLPAPAGSWSGLSVAGSTFSSGSLASGVYAVTFTPSSSSCLNPANTSITVNAKPVISPNLTGFLCGASAPYDGTVSLEVANGFSNYQWSPGVSGTGNAVTVTLPGNYTVTVTNSDGCTETTTFTVTPRPKPNPTLNAPAVLCAGGSSTLNLGASYGSYLWNDASTNSTLSVSGPGVYTVTVTDVNGCSASVSKTINSGTALSPTILPFGKICGAGTVNLSLSSTYNTYNWSNSGNTQTITVSSGGNYDVTVTDTSTGCTGTASATVQQFAAPDVSIDGNTNICQGATTTLTANPANFSNYQWSNSNNTSSINISMPSVYSLTATDVNGCTVVKSVTLTNSAAPTPIINGNSSVCTGQTTTLSLGGGVFSSYVWSNGSTDNSITIGNGNYMVTVTDANGCTATTSKNVSEDIVSVGIVGNLNVCPSKTTLLSLNNSFNSYSWSGGENTPTVTATPGNYSVTVSNSNSCTATASVVVNAASSPSVTITGNPVYCQGTLNQLGTSSGFISYQWSTGQSSPVIFSLGTATYSVTVADINGCTAVDSKNVVQNPQPTPNISGSFSICSGATTTLDAGAGFSSYLWNIGPSTQTITTNQPGLYIVSVTDANSCIGVASANVISNGSINFNISGKSSFCEGETTVLNAGAGFSTYLWDTGEATQSITVSAAKVYSVTVSNGSCNGSASINVVKNNNPVFTISGKTSICEGQSSSLTPNQSFINYKWSNGDLNASLVTTQAGSYSVTVTDANGCSAVGNVSLTINANPKPTIDGKSSICLGDSAKLSVNQSFASYLWSNGKTQKDIFIKNINLYSVTVTDINGCTGNAALNISQIPDLKPIITSNGSFCEGDTLHINVNAGFQKYLWSSGQNSNKIIVTQGGKYILTVTDGACKGMDSITVNMNLLPDITISKDTAICEGFEVALKADAGTAIYSWSNGINTPFNNVKDAGKYKVTVTSSAGCSSFDSVNVIVNPNPKPNILGQGTICFGETITLKLDEKYSIYKWSNNTTTDSLNVSQSGTYRVTVTSDKGCTAETSKQIEIKANLSPKIIGKNTICEIGGEVELKLDGAYSTYLWSTVENTPSITVTKAGDYFVTVTSASGCSGETKITIKESKNPIPILLGDFIICGTKAAIIDAGNGFSSYLWSNGLTTQKIEVKSIGGYSVTVTNAEGCTGDSGTSVSFAQVNGDFKDSLCQSEFKIFNGKRYDKNNPKGTEILIGAASGGCDSILNIELFFKPEVNVSFSGIDKVCKSNQATDLTINVTGYSGVFDLTYQENNGAEITLTGVKNGDKIPISPAKTSVYTIKKIVLPNGYCIPTKFGSFTITISPLSFTKKVTNITCANLNNGAISLTVTGTLPIIYKWSNGETTADLRDLNAGKYAVTVEDAQGCQAQDSMAISSPTPISFKAIGQGICNANKGEIVIQSITGGTGDFVYSTDNQIFEQVGNLPYKIQNLNIGTYQLKVAEANDKNCGANIEVKINPSDSLKVELGNDITLLYGDSIVLTPKAAFQMSKIRWSPKNTLSCDTCQFVIAKPKATTKYYVTVWDENGCIAKDDINIIINKIRRVFVPTAFSPDANGNNDLFRVFLGDEVLKVHSFRIFDRWGTVVYQDLDFTKAESQDIKRGWDGTYRGEALQQSVFIYHIRVEFTDGEIKDYTGDVMLMGR